MWDVMEADISADADEAALPVSMVTAVSGVARRPPSVCSQVSRCVHSRKGSPLTCVHAKVVQGCGVACSASTIAVF